VRIQRKYKFKNNSSIEQNPMSDTILISNMFQHIFVIIRIPIKYVFGLINLQHIHIQKYHSYLSETISTKY